MARLIVNPCTPQAWQILLKEGVNSLGRGEGNDVRIDDASVSGSHCQVILAEGTARLRDLGSTNGTFVNGTPITEANLEAGQYFQLGGVQLVFESADQATAIQPLQSERSPSVDSGTRMTGASGGGPVRITLATVNEPPAALTPLEAPAEPNVARTVAAPAIANARCKYHPRTLARWVCTGCHKTYCDLCVSVRPGAAGSQMFCRSCGGVADRLQVTIETPRQRSFFRKLPRAITYPFRGTGLMILIGATLVFAALDFISVGIIGLVVQMIALGYFFSYVQSIIHSTAAEDDELPDLPGMDDVFSGFFQLLGVVLMSFGPALLMAYLAIAQEQPGAGIALIPAAVFGCLYFPMAFWQSPSKTT